MYVNHEFTIAVITVIFALCRDFCVTTVIITKISTISIFTRSILCKYLQRIFFLSAYNRTIIPTSLPGVLNMQNDGIMHSLHGCTALS